VRIVALAYACEPGKGSEQGVGWVFARLLGRLGETWVITRANNRDTIEPSLDTLPEGDRLHFEYVDLPPAWRFYKRGHKGARLYYLLWQRAALKRAREVVKREKADVVWHLTVANAWLGSAGGLAGAPFVYGPIGGGTGVPWRLLPTLGAKGAAYEVLRATAQATGRYLNPLARIAWRRAELILVQNENTHRWLPKRHRDKVRIFHHAVMHEDAFVPRKRREGPPTALYAGRLIAWKGVALAIRAMAELPEWRFLVCGGGPDERRLKQLAEKLGLTDRVIFRGWVDRAELWRLMREEADIFLFPSLHDEAPLAVAESTAVGLPVVCLDLGGPPILAGESGHAVSASGSGADVVARLAAAVRAAGHGPNAGPEAADHIHFEARLEALRELVTSARIGADADRATG
jgi:glycosyltransferase involved in cell wall biosynthesis